MCRVGVRVWATGVHRLCECRPHRAGCTNLSAAALQRGEQPTASLTSWRVEGAGGCMDWMTVEMCARSRKKRVSGTAGARKCRCAGAVTTACENGVVAHGQTRLHSPLVVPRKPRRSKVPKGHAWHVPLHHLGIRQRRQARRKHHIPPVCDTCAGDDTIVPHLGCKNTASVLRVMPRASSTRGPRTMCLVARKRPPLSSSAHSPSCTARQSRGMRTCGHKCKRQYSSMTCMHLVHGALSVLDVQARVWVWGCHLFRPLQKHGRVERCA